MSLFYPDPPSQKESKKEDVSWEQLLGVLFAFIGIAIYLKWQKVEDWYYDHFENIYLAAYGAFAVMGGVVAWRIVKSTKELTLRARLLFAFTYPDRGILVGTTTDGLHIYLPEAIRIGHVQILGSTGRGKTESVIIPWIGRDLIAGRSLILIDGKGDPEIVERVRAIAPRKSPQPDIYVFDLGNPKQSCTTNPLAHGSPQQITDRLFTAFDFKDLYYKSVQYDLCSAVIGLMMAELPETEMMTEVTFESLYGCLTDEPRLTALIASKPTHPSVAKLTEHLGFSREVQEKRLSGLLSQLAPFAIGEVAPLVNGKRHDNTPNMTVSEILLSKNGKQKLFLILIPTLKYQQLGHQLGKLLMQELGWVVGERASQMGKKAPFSPVYLDEFSAFVYEGFANILNKARSSKIPFHLSHQSLADLSKVSPDFAQMIATNTNVKCLLGLNDPESADFMARHMGTKTQEKLTEQAEKTGFLEPKRKTGAMSVRDVEAYKVHPNDLKSFVAGRGVIHFPSAGGNVTEEIQFARIEVEDFTNQGGMNG